MNEYLASPDEIYYTKDHDWIQYKGSLAITGVSGFKLTGIKEIHQFIINEPMGLKRQGETLAIIHSNDYCIEILMPVSGLVLQINTELARGNLGLLVKEPERGGWVARIKPLQPEERGGLLSPVQYSMKINGKMVP